MDNLNVLIGFGLNAIGLGGAWYAYTEKFKTCEEELNYLRDEFSKMSKTSGIQNDRRLPELQAKLENGQRELQSEISRREALGNELDQLKRQLDNEKAKTKDLIGRLESLANQPPKQEDESINRIIDTLIRVRDRVNENVGSVSDSVGSQALHSIDRFALAELVKLGVEEYQTTNQMFDEAVSKATAIEDQGRPSKTVLQTIRCGYRYKGEISRFEEVVIQK
jgi:molecular chaperone GrpE (heat shock protein)